MEKHEHEAVELRFIPAEWFADASAIADYVQGPGFNSLMDSVEAALMTEDLVENAGVAGWAILRDLRQLLDASFDGVSVVDAACPMIEDAGALKWLNALIRCDRERDHREVERLIDHYLAPLVERSDREGAESMALLRASLRSSEPPEEGASA